MSYFVTGGTGFIGRYVLERLLERKGQIYVLVRPQSQGADGRDHRAPRRAQGPHRSGHRRHHRAAPRPQLRPTARRSRTSTTSFTSVRSTTSRPATRSNRETNVGGTINAVRSATARPRNLSPHQLDRRRRPLQRRLPRRHVRRRPEARVPVRPHEVRGRADRARRAAPLRGASTASAIVVGDSKTGAIDKIDGPYLIFKWIKRASEGLPAWLPTVGIVGGRVNMVPVDFVAGAIDHLMHKHGLDGRTFHLVDPYPPTRRRSAHDLRQTPAAHRYSAPHQQRDRCSPLPRMLLRHSRRLAADAR